MAQLCNLFALLDTEEEDASSIAGVTSAATVNAGKVQEKKKPQKTKSPVYNPMMTKSNGNVLPDHVSRQQPVITKEKPERERRVGDDRKKTENLVNGNGNSNNGSSFQGNFKGSGNRNSNNGYFQGNFKGSDPHNNPQNARNNYGGFQGNSRRNLGYNGNSRAPNQYRNHRNSNNDLQGTNVGVVNVQKTENLVDAEGWQIFHGRRGKTEIAFDNQSQNGGGFNGYGGDRRWRRSDRGNQVNNNGREDENSGVCEKEVEIVSVNGVESNVNEGEKDSTESKKDGDEAPKKKQDDDEKVAKKKEEIIQITLQEYEKLQLEKRMAIESQKQQAEQRKVVLDKDLESMLLVKKKKSNEDEQVMLLVEKKKSNEDEHKNSVVAKKKDKIKGEKIELENLSTPSYRVEFLRKRNERLKRNEEKFNDKNGEEAKKNDKNGEEAKKHNKKGEEPKKHNKNEEEAKKPNNHVNGSTAATDLAPIVIVANQFPALGPMEYPLKQKKGNTD